MISPCWEDEMSLCLVIHTLEDVNVITRSSDFFDTDSWCMSDFGLQANVEFDLALAKAIYTGGTCGAFVIFLDAADNTLVGWYRNANLHAELQYHLPSQRWYRANCETRNTFLLSKSNRRTLKLPIANFNEFVFVDDSLSKQLIEYLDSLQKTADFVPLCLDISMPKIPMQADTKTLAEQYFDTGDTSLLPQVYHSALEWANQDSKDASPWNYQGFALLELARPQKALACFEKALELDPLHTSSARDKGECLIRLDRTDEAVSWLNAALTRFPTDEMRIQLSDAYLFAGFPGISYRILKTLETTEARRLTEPFINEREKSMPYLLHSKPEHSVPDAYPILLDFKSETLPEVYEDAYGLKRYIDPIRKKGVPVTPEERIRQLVIAYLLKHTKVPHEMILVEESLAHIDRELRDRVDVLVSAIHSGKQKHILLVECKAPGIALLGEPTTQLLRYNAILGVPFVLLTNGNESQLFHFSDTTGEYRALRELPTYKEMCQTEGIKYVQLQSSKWVRPAYDSLTHPEVISEYTLQGIIGEGSPSQLKPFMLNLAFCLLDEDHKIVCPLTLPGCTIETDYGVVPMTTGNAGGGSFTGNFRWLGIIDRQGQRQNVYLAVFGIGNTDKAELADFKTEATTLYFAVEEKGKAVSRLQIRLDSCLKSEGKGYRLTHTGVRSRAKVQPLIDYIGATVPELWEQTSE